jgi:hypothetical protein
MGASAPVRTHKQPSLVVETRGVPAPASEGSLMPNRPPRPQHAFALLRAGVPLTLLLDLAQPDPRSAEIYVREACPKAS